MSILWHWAPDVWLWILLIIGLDLGPVVMKERREGAIWVCVLWHWTTNVWLWILGLSDVSIKLSLGPIIMEEA